MPPRLPTTPATLDASSLDQALATFQERIDQLQQNLADQNKLATLGMVAAVLAHEFNNILTPMISYTTVALSDQSDEALRTKALTKALAGAQRLSNISQSLLGFARGGTSNEPATANVKLAITETLSCLARDLAKDAITLTVEIPDNLHVAMNPGQLQQVLMNLIVNARAAMLSLQNKAGRPKRLTIKASTTDTLARITIADHRPGHSRRRSPPNLRSVLLHQKIRHRDSRRRPRSAPPRGGTGLGLTICHQLLAAANATIHATGAPTQGATFTLEIPLAK